jgi:preprotein translocase subunit YajC
MATTMRMRGMKANAATRGNAGLRNPGLLLHFHPSMLPLLAEAAPPPAENPAGGTTSTSDPAGGDGAPPATGGGDSLMTMVMFFGLTLFVMYFLMIRPQRKKEQDLRSMVDRLKKDDKVILTGGIFGVVARVGEKDLSIKIDEKQDVRIRVLKSAVMAVIGKDGKEVEGADTKPKEPQPAEEKTEAGK